MDKKAIKLLKIQSWQLWEYERLLSKKEAYLSAAFHEIRNPISSLINLLEGAKHFPVGSCESPDINGLYESSEKLLSIINNVLNDIKSDGFKITNQNTQFSLLKMMLEVESIFSPQFTVKNIQWVSDYSFSSQLVIQGKREQLIRILNNLIGNALKHTSCGTIGVRVRALAFSQGKVTLEFSIKDTGTGMESWHLEKLCNSFIQIENSSAEKMTNSTGLGLAICHQLIQGLGGKLNITSKIGQGSCFSFTIVVPAEKHTNAISSNNLPAATVLYPSTSSRKEKVLYVDDDFSNGQLMVQFLEKVGISCDLALKGSEALNLCRHLPRDYYTLILTDFFLPDMNGAELSLICKYFLQIQCPFICISGISPKELAKHQTEVGTDGTFQDFMEKPFSLPQLYRLISKHCNNTFVNGFCNTEFAAELTPEVDEFITKHRKKFKENYVASANEFFKLHENRDYDSLKKYAHYLKGLLGLLGFDDLLQIVNQIELEAEEAQDQNLVSEIQAFSEALKVTLSKI